MKKIVALSGIVAFLAVILVFSACAAVTAWWSGPWIWGAAMLLSEGQEAPVAAFDEEGTIMLSGSVHNPIGKLIDENGEELVMEQIDLSQKGFITFVVNGEVKEGLFDKENGRIIEQ
ncbi:MAG TPA: hypothetical protein P5107_05105 [Thermotogota bacterium]|nr:hypothetical protein [Thermotogota bacterium]HRW34414.1 hypothetical protein [Thermotogota bacterium]